MAKVTIFCLVCIIVAASSLTSCSAARGLPSSIPSDAIKSSETTTSTSASKPSGVVADVDVTTSSTTTEPDVDWEELSEDEFGSCMKDAEPGAEELSSESESERPCRRMLPDYGSPGSNKNKKGP